ncbi:PqqD family protein [Olivibacter sp. CPCC 100613]|uniref:PqqD family protein n=1 Tax=Olivibacter sp. CPCC 100613 TaxID=3079931 RepID=UPI002FF5CC8B
MKFRTDLILRQFGNDYIIVDPGQSELDISKLIRFNETAAQVWRDLQGQTLTVAKIAQVLQSHYEVHVEDAERDAKNLIIQFQMNALFTEE